MPSESPLTSPPPKPPLALRVGVVGHRPDRLKSADLDTLGETIRGLLEIVKNEVHKFRDAHGDWLSGEPELLRAISSVAEGTDRVFAGAALDLDYALTCPTPFFLDEFKKDFDPPHALEPRSRERFEAILTRAQEKNALVVFEMDGDRAAETVAYGDCTNVVINQSDLLILVWDGERLGKRGGTEDAFDEAMRRSQPTVWIDAHAPHPWRVLVPADAHAVKPSAKSDRNETVAVQELVRSRLRLHIVRELPGHHTPPYRTSLDDFLTEKPAVLLDWPWWSLFQRIVLWSAGPEVDDEDDSKEDPPPTAAPTTIQNGVLQPYGASDGAATRYADAYRSAFVVAYLLAASAVGFALLPLALGFDIFENSHHEIPFVAAELILIISILWIVRRGRHRGWHARWLDYRLAAELFRHLRISAPLANPRAFPQVPAHLASYDPASSWMAWYVRAFERQLGLPHTRLDQAYLRTCAQNLRAEVFDQVTFHKGNAHRKHAVEITLHRWSLRLLMLTLIGCSLHLFVNFTAIPIWPWVLGTLAFISGFMPALGAALAGINNQGEFRRLTFRSEAMEERLGHLQHDLDAYLRSTPHLRSRELAVFASQAAQIMVNEVLEWRVVFLDQPLRDP